MTAALDTEFARWQASVFEIDLRDVRSGTIWPPGANGNEAISALRSAVLEGAKGHEINRALTATLNALGVDMRYLDGGVQDWLAQGRPIEPLAAAARSV